MGKTLLGYPDYTRATTTLVSNVGGVEWDTTLPLTNLRTQLLSHVARSATAATNATWWKLDMGEVMPTRVVSLMGHNISVDGTVRVRGYLANGTTVAYDSGTVRVWPASFTVADVAANPNNWTLPLASVVNAQIWRVDVYDSTNSAGYIQIGRCWISPAWNPTVGVSYDSNILYEPRSIPEESLGGELWFDTRLPRRVAAIAFPDLSDVEKRTGALIQKNISNSSEMLYVENYEHAAEDMLLWAFPVTAKQYDPLKSPYFGSSEMAMVIVEIIGGIPTLVYDGATSAVLYDDITGAKFTW